MLFALLVVRRFVDLVDRQHISHEDNQRADCLSRHGSWAEVLALDRKLSEPRGRLRPNTPCIELECSVLLELCDPRKPLRTDDDLAALFAGALDIL